jgi:hypothetical protein
VLCQDKELRIERLISPVNDVVDRERIHVMDDRSSRDLEAGHSEIASFVSYDDMVTKVSPLSRSVELLI